MEQIESVSPAPAPHSLQGAQMLVSREELHFDWGGAGFDLQKPDERKLLAWIFNQFLYGEVTGIQCGHWLYHSPSLQAATFIAKQAGEELVHVRKFLRMFSLLGERPGPAHWAVRYLSTGMMGGSWGEHVAIEMALGEGLVLCVFYAMIETTRGHAEINKILETSAPEEERHVEFGERETKQWLKEHPGTRAHLLGLALVQTVALQAIRGFVTRLVAKQVGEEHPVLGKFGAFYEHTLRCFELRTERLGLSDRPLRQLSRTRKFALIAALPFWKAIGLLKRRAPLLTKTYLDDPALEAEARRHSRPAS